MRLLALQITARSDHSPCRKQPPSHNTYWEMANDTKVNMLDTTPVHHNNNEAIPASNTIPKQTTLHTSILNYIIVSELYKIMWLLLTPLNTLQSTLASQSRSIRGTGGTEATLQLPLLDSVQLMNYDQANQPTTSINYSTSIRPMLDSLGSNQRWCRPTSSSITEHAANELAILAWREVEDGLGQASEKHGAIDW